MARKTSRRVAASKRKKPAARKGKKSPATKRASSATARSASAGSRKAVSVERFVRSIKTLHDLGLVVPFVQSAKRAGLTLTMDSAALERVKKTVNKLRQPVPVSAGASSPASIRPAARSIRHSEDEDPFDFARSTGPGGLGDVKPLEDEDPFDF
jgi:hypothetical protein